MILLIPGWWNETYQCCTRRHLNLLVCECSQRRPSGLWVPWIQHWQRCEPQEGTTYTWTPHTTSNHFHSPESLNWSCFKMCLSSPSSTSELIAGKHSFFLRPDVSHIYLTPFKFCLFSWYSPKPHQRTCCLNRWIPLLGAGRMKQEWAFLGHWLIIPLSLPFIYSSLSFIFPQKYHASCFQ